MINMFQRPLTTMPMAYENHRRAPSSNLVPRQNASSQGVKPEVVYIYVYPTSGMDRQQAICC